MIIQKEIDWDAYEEGFITCRRLNNDNKNKSHNPYPTGSIKWKSWNRGWNRA